MAEQLRDVDAISRNKAAPTFDNTLVALERSGALLNRVGIVFFNLAQSNTNDALTHLEEDITPKLAAHRDAIWLNAALFARIEAVYQKRHQLHLDAESLQLLERQHLVFVRAGARLPDAEQQRLRTINEQLASATTKFRLNVLKAGEDGAVVVDDVAQLKGMSEADIAAAAQGAKARGQEGKYLLTLQNTTVQPVLKDLQDRGLRERVFRASVERATQGATDNRPVIEQIVRLRAERAHLLGYPSHAAYVVEDNAAATPEAVNAMMAQLAPLARNAAQREAADIQRLIDAQAAQAQTPTFALQAWDWDFYAEQVRKARYTFNEAEVKPYFELDRVLKDGAFHVAHELYGLSFKERRDLHAYRDDVRIFEVREADGSPLGLFMADFFARDNKQGGAWMSNYVEQSTLLGSRPVVVNNLNITKPAPGEPVLLSFDDVTTIFHEFGHALHGLLSHVRYASLSGANVPGDFVEFPSQYNEMWAREPAVLAHFARHYKTGAPLPEALFQRVLSAQNFNNGFEMTSYLAAAMLDMRWHQLDLAQVPQAEQVMAFEDAALRDLGMNQGAVPVRYHSPYFLHIFSGGYDAGYYAYQWSELLARDTGAWLHAHGGLTRANGTVLRTKILSRGRTEEPGKLFEAFYGGPPQVEPLLEYHGMLRKDGAN
jgi:peptidyl-dipeptidase Dcp